VQYRLPVKVLILNNEWMGMVRQWQQLLHGERYSQSYSQSLPDFVRLAEAYGATGLRVERPDELDEALRYMVDTPGPVVLDCRVVKEENCFPMIPSGRAHNDMLLGDAAAAIDIGEAIDPAGRRLV
jgi:acetolactate synthase I/II/III large subunit